MTISKFLFHLFMCLGSMLLIFFICWDLSLAYELIVNSVMKTLDIINAPFTKGMLTLYLICLLFGVTKEY